MSPPPGSLHSCQWGAGLSPNPGVPGSQKDLGVNPDSPPSWQGLSSLKQDVHAGLQPPTLLPLPASFLQASPECRLCARHCPGPGSRTVRTCAHPTPSFECCRGLRGMAASMEPALTCCPFLSVRKPVASLFSGCGLWGPGASASSSGSGEPGAL